jgi:hypothetical protein
MRRILNQAANAAVKHKGSVFQILYRRYVPRLGHNQTIGVIAHRLCRLTWKILHQGLRLYLGIHGGFGCKTTPRVSLYLGIHGGFGCKTTPRVSWVRRWRPICAEAGKPFPSLSGR